MNVKIEGLELDQLNPHEFGGMCSRATAVLHRAEGKSLDDGIDTIATTDAPAKVIDWTRWEMIREILPMRYCVKPENDKAVLLDAHSRWSVADAKGSARNWETNEHELLCKTFVSVAEPQVRQKVEDGTIDSVSIGYETDKTQTVEIPKGKSVIVDGVEYKNEYEDDTPLVVRTWWKVKELSLVPIGADAAAKLKRAMTEGIKADDPDLQKILNNILASQKSLQEQITINQSKGGLPMAETKEVTQEQLRAEAIAEILEASENYSDAGKDLAKATVKEIREGKEVDANTVKTYLLKATDLLIKSGGGSNKPLNNLGMSGKELEDYSATRAIQTLASGKRSGLEFEISDTLEKMTGDVCKAGEILTPNDVRNAALLRAFPEYFERAHSMGTTTEGGYLVQPTYRGDMLKEVLRNDTVLGRLGATIITGLKGQFQMPKIVSGLTMYNVAENTAATTSYVVVGLETVDQKRMSGNTKYGRQMFMNIDPSVGGFDQLLIRDLYNSADVKLDYDGINGDGLGNNPSGFLSLTGPAAATLSTIGWKQIVNFQRLIAKAKGREEDLKWGMSVDVKSVLDITPKVSGQAIMLRENKLVNNYACESSNQFPDAAAALGFWPEFFVLLWGTEKLSIADQPSHKSDEIEISLHRYGNFFLRSSESFAAAENAAIDIWNVD